MTELTLSARNKSFPASSWGRSATEFLAASPSLAAFQTPVVTLDASAIESNTRLMFSWLRENDLEIAPHGKTTMAPALWRALLDAGAWGMTFATIWQVQCARSFGIRRVMLANELVDPIACDWVGRELDADPDFDFSCWVDSVDAVEAMAAQVSGTRQIPVIIELGAAHGRTGARSVEDAVLIARAVVDSGVLEIAGVGGYEGALGHDRSELALSRVDGYLDSLVLLHRRLADAGWFGSRIPIVTAGGSAYFDRVADRLAPLTSEATVVLRSGAFQVHDDGFYRGITPMGSLVGNESFRAGMHAWVRVLSRPEPTLALFDAGKRDIPYDEGMPVPQRVRGLDRAASDAVLAGSSVTALNDQHGFLRLADSTPSGALPVGSVLRLGLSHPCTLFDKWRVLPVIDDADAVDPTVAELVETYF